MLLRKTPRQSFAALNSFFAAEFKNSAHYPYVALHRKEYLALSFPLGLLRGDTQVGDLPSKAHLLDIFIALFRSVLLRGAVSCGFGARGLSGCIAILFLLLIFFQIQNASHV